MGPYLYTFSKVKDCWKKCFRCRTPTRASRCLKYNFGHCCDGARGNFLYYSFLRLEFNWSFANSSETTKTASTLQLPSCVEPYVKGPWRQLFWQWALMLRTDREIQYVRLSFSCTCDKLPDYWLTTWIIFVSPQRNGIDNFVWGYQIKFPNMCNLTLGQKHLSHKSITFLFSMRCLV